MSQDDLLRCETCGNDIHNVKTPIFEKPLRMAFRSDMKVLKQNTSDYRKQENICLECFSKELNSLSEDCQTKMEIIEIKISTN